MWRVELSDGSTVRVWNPSDLIREAEELATHRSSYYGRQILVSRIVPEAAGKEPVHVMKFCASLVPSARDPQLLKRYFYDMVMADCVRGGQMIYVISMATDTFMHILLRAVPGTNPVHVMSRSETVSLIYAKK